MYLAPARDTGGMVHGRFFGRALNYSAGLFAHDGDNARSKKVAGGDRTFGARVSGTPLAKVKAMNLDKAEFGGNFTTTEVSDESELPNGLRGRTVVSQYTFFDPVFVKGTRNRYGADFEWTLHSVGARAEYITVTDERQGQGLRGDDLNSARARAYYVSGTWVVTGDKKDRPLEPKRPLFRGGGGAVELAARYERMWFDSKETGEPPFSNSRAEVILPNGDKVLTLGRELVRQSLGKASVQRRSRGDRGSRPDAAGRWRDEVLEHRLRGAAGALTRDPSNACHARAAVDHRLAGRCPATGGAGVAAEGARSGCAPVRAA